MSESNCLTASGLIKSQSMLLRALSNYLVNIGTEYQSPLQEACSGTLTVKKPFLMLRICVNLLFVLAELLSQTIFTSQLIEITAKDELFSGFNDFRFQWLCLLCLVPPTTSGMQGTDLSPALISWSCPLTVPTWWWAAHTVVASLIL